MSQRQKANGQAPPLVTTHTNGLVESPHSNPPSKIEARQPAARYTRPQTIQQNKPDASNPRGPHESQVFCACRMHHPKWRMALITYLIDQMRMFDLHPSCSCNQVCVDISRSNCICALQRCIRLQQRHSWLTHLRLSNMTKAAAHRMSAGPCTCMHMYIDRPPLYSSGS